MSNYLYTSDIKADALWRADEPTDGTSDFDSKVMDYINRAYQAVWEGGSEIVPDVREDWIWLYKKGILTHTPAFNLGTITVTKNSTALTFSQVPVDAQSNAISVQGWYLMGIGALDAMVIASHTSGQTNATLDSPWTVASGSYSFQCFNLEYDLNSDVMELMSPMWVRTTIQSFPWDPAKVAGMDLEAIRTMWPLDRIVAGVPSAFALIADRRIRFNTYPVDLLRVEYDYKMQPADLTNGAQEQPLIPYRFRRILADLACFYLQTDKNDSRAALNFKLGENMLRAMQRDNRNRRMAQDQTYGQIYPRVARMNRMMPFRTSGGLIVG